MAAERRRGEDYAEEEKEDELATDRGKQLRCWEVLTMVGGRDEKGRIKHGYLYLVNPALSHVIFLDFSDVRANIGFSSLAG